jgi:membrane-associated protease RseP (regulator of RpoE activity)
MKTIIALPWVYVTNYEDGGESKISGLIEQGGAQEAGLLEGDVIIKINEYDVTDFPSLRLALSHFQPGDVVTVRYVRNDKNQKARVELKDWAVLPGFEWRARTDCGDKEIKEEEVEPINEIVPGISEVQPLKLQDAKVFPNPTEGVFAFAFHTEPGPLTVSITDVNGKVVYSENEDNETGSYSQEIDLEGLPHGNYIITVTQGDRVYTNQISKQ